MKKPKDSNTSPMESEMPRVGKIPEANDIHGLSRAKEDSLGLKQAKIHSTEAAKVCHSIPGPFMPW